MTEKSFYINILGCPMRAIEAQRLNNYFCANGMTNADEANADLIVVFTCSVVDDTESKSIAYINSIDQKSKRLILLGCSPAMSPQKFAENFNGDMLSTKDLEDKIDELFPSFLIKFNDIALPADFKADYSYGDYYLKQFGKHTKKSFYSFSKAEAPALIISSKGCNNFCSFCTMKRALGPVKSYPVSNIVDNYIKQKEAGKKVFIFNADDTGSYGLDINSSFAELLDKIYEADEKLSKGSRIWVIDNLNPMWLIKYFDAFQKYCIEKKICEIIVPLQSGTNRILELMRRKYQIDEVLSELRELKVKHPKLVLKTHFIMGFPSETEEDVDAVAEIIKSKLFDHIILLKYYETENCPSSRISPKISDDLVLSRILRLEKMLMETKTEFLIDGIVT